MSQITIATTTFYPNVEDLRFKLASRFVQDAVAASHRVVVIDGSPDQAVGEAFDKLGAIVYKQETPGMGPGRREAIGKAALAEERSCAGEIRVVAWVEPEKYPVVPFLSGLSDEMKAGGVDLIIPRRRSLAGYPKYQQLCELRGNWEVGNHTGRPDLDLWFGPRIIGTRAVRHFTQYRGEWGDKWDSIFIPVAWALAAKLEVCTTVVDYVHPPEQTSVEASDPAMDRKRNEQLETLTNAMGHECRKLGLSL